MAHARMKAIILAWGHTCTHSDILLVEIFAKVGEACISDEAGIQSSQKFALLRGFVPRIPIISFVVCQNH